ncbi:MAG: hypothetical protein L6Q38_09655, partial [Nitrospira sp.]|nr:hypothetical protein [Nitrospira sp.]
MPSTYHLRVKRYLACGAAMAWMLFLPPFVRAQVVTQELVLRPGWNSVFIEVTPPQNEPSRVFEGIPVESVWTRSERVTASDFVRNQNEVSWNDSDWRVFRPPHLPGAFATTLHAILANRAYLVHLAGTASITWRVQGRPSLKHPAWVPDAFNLRGFPIDPNNRPTYLYYFRSSTAHFDAAGGRLEAFYRLETDGLWRPVAPNDRMTPGEAVWAYCRGASTFVAPLQVRADFDEQLEFGPVAPELSLRLLTLGSLVREARVAPVSEAGRSLWSVFSVSPATGQISWPALGSEIRRSLTPGQSTVLRLAPRRSLFPEVRATEILTITDGSGARWWIPLSADRGTSHATTTPSVSQYAGLWHGSIRVQRVSEAAQASDSPPTPTRAPFTLRMLLHVDAQGQPRLLQEAIQLWEPGTWETRSDGVRVPAQTGRFVLLSDARFGESFRGAPLGNEAPTGRRLSTADFDFSGYPSNTLALSGLFKPGSRVEGTYHLSPNAPTHPFRHAYHPDHDNLDERFSGPRTEAYAITRAFTFDLAASDPTGFSSPDYGHEVIAGNYR